MSVENYLRDEREIGTRIIYCEFREHIGVREKWMVELDRTREGREVELKREEERVRKK